MPNLRELLRNVDEYDETISQAAYTLLEALVEILEPTRVLNPNETVAAQHREIGRLRQQTIELVETAEGLRSELEEVRKHKDSYRKRYMRVLSERDQIRAKLETKNDDAELGKLVRGMRSNSQLVKGGVFYWGAVKNVLNNEWSLAEQPPLSSDPNIALRSIQKEEDDA